MDLATPCHWERRWVGVTQSFLFTCHRIAVVGDNADRHCGSESDYCGHHHCLCLHAECSTSDVRRAACWLGRLVPRRFKEPCFLLYPGVSAPVWGVWGHQGSAEQGVGRVGGADRGGAGNVGKMIERAGERRLGEEREKVGGAGLWQG